MDTLRTTAIVVLGSALAAGAVMARAGTPLAVRSLAIAAPGQVIHPDPPVIPPPPPSDRAVVEAARQARAAKEAKQAREAAKHLTVWNDDNIPRIPRDITVVGRSETNPGSEPAAADGSETAATSGATPAPQTRPAPSAASRDIKEELTRTRERAADLEKDSELAQRQFELDQNQISQNPDYGNDHAGQTKLKSEAAEVQAKRQQLDELKKKINDLESQTKP